MPDNYILNESLIKLENELQNVSTANKLIQIARETSEKEVNEIKSLADTLLNNSKEIVKETINSASELNNSSRQLQSAVQSLVVKIEQIDFPSRLGKIEDSMSGISVNLANLQAVLLNLERNIKDDIHSRIKDVVTEIENTKTIFDKRISGFKVLFMIVSGISICLLVIILAKVFGSI